MLELNDFEIDAVAGGFGLLAPIGFAMNVAGAAMTGAGILGTLFVPVIGPLIGVPLLGAGLGVMATGLAGLAASLVLPIL